MLDKSNIIKNFAITFAILFGFFVIGVVIQSTFKNDSLIPAIFVLAVFIVSVVTDGYIYGIFSAIASVIIVNFVFTYPFFKLNFLIAGNVVSAVILIVVTLITCSLTAKLKKQEMAKAEGETERLRANLLRAVSHDLRTPLTTIYGSSSALIENEWKLSEKQKLKMLKGIQEEAEWLTRMVENLLSITKLDNGNVRIIKSPTVLDELVDSILLKFHKRYPQQEVIVDLPEELVIIPMDPILIEQVAVNILENAVQHAVGMTKLSFKVFTSSARVVFEIKDNGCGIPREKLNSLFSGCYNSEEDAVDSKKNYAGIGLSVCLSIIKAHGGEIKATCLKKGGTSIMFVLDLEDKNE